MRGRTKTEWWGVVLEAPDGDALNEFYSKLLDWPIDGGAVHKPGTEFYVACNTSPEYVPPVWPPVEGRQQMMLHLDIEVDDLELAVADAVALGATLAEFQPQETVRVLLDPAGHPFCLYT
jgi:catechol 2,3-dioxygenase-like lactoylglutathione lyase family enzyme